MADLTIVQKKVRPLLGAITRPYILGGPAEVGEPVYVASDSDVERADADAADTAQAIGVIVGIGSKGELTGVAGATADVTVFGPVGFGGVTLTPGAQVFVSPNAGKIETTAPAGASGDFRWILGRAEGRRVGSTTETVIFVNPYTDDPAAQ